MLTRSHFLLKKANPYSSTVKAFMEFVQVDKRAYELRSTDPDPLANKPPLFRLDFELFGKKAPLCTENFARLCQGSAEDLASAMEASESIHEPSFRDQFLPQLTYQNSSVHRVVRDFCVQGGNVAENFVTEDLATGNVDPSPQQSLVYPDGKLRHKSSQFRDVPTTVSVFGEEFDAGAELGAVKFDRSGLLGTAVSAPHKNNSQFFVLLPESGAKHLDGTCVCFGRVTKGLEALKKWQKSVQLDFEGRPVTRLQISKCGML